MSATRRRAARRRHGQPLRAEPDLRAARWSSGCSEVSPIPLDVHLMITDVDRWAPGYAELGAFSVTFHAEATDEPVALARQAARRSARGPASRSSPAPPSSPYLELLPEFDQLLVMTVEPGFGGQSFMEDMLPKIRAVREAVARRPVALAAGRRRHLADDDRAGLGGRCRHVRRRLERVPVRRPGEGDREPASDRRRASVRPRALRITRARLIDWTHD